MALTKEQRAQLSRLQTVTELVYRQDVAAYQAHRTKIDELETSISKLRDGLQDVFDPTSLDSADMILLNKHRSWVKKMLRALNIDLAKAYADAEAQRARLVLSNGRKVAVTEIQTKK